ncbi:MAG: hypothetical protein VB051_11810 [Candidatus Pelethousia sp.]|nr:hypothetical protein [Candidatus Pelethousia sp.]
MINPHQMVRQALCAWLEPAASLTEEDICTDARDCQASVPLAWRAQLPAEEALARAFDGPPARLLGAPLVEKAYLSGGYACFLLTGEAYAAMLTHIIASAPQPNLPDPGRGEVDYAIARMLMLSRKGGVGCPADARARQALWLVMGIIDARGPRRDARKKRAARALTGLMRERPVKERIALAASMGQAAACAARLLAYGATY